VNSVVLPAPGAAATSAHWSWHVPARLCRASHRLALVLTVALAIVASVRSTVAEPLFDAPFYAFHVGAFPHSIAAGDFDRDGLLDLATANYGQSGGGNGTVSVLRGLGDGTFDGAIPRAVGNNPTDLKAVDVDRDGYVDLVAANEGGSSISILYGDGNGAFPTRADLIVGSSPREVVIFDANLDSLPDLAVANGNAHSLSVYLALSSRVFGPRVDIALNAQPYCLATGDLNEDGKPDLVTASELGQWVLALFGDGSGGFSSPTTLASGLRATHVMIDHLDSDTHVDLAVVVNWDNRVTVFPGLGNGSIGAGLNYSVPFGPRRVRASDLNADGVVDLCVATSSSLIGLLLGQGDGTFTTLDPVPAGGSADDALVADFDGDGDGELAVPVEGGNWVRLFPGDGSGAFGAQGSIETAVEASSVSVGDLNEDGAQDYLVTHSYVSFASLHLSRPDGGHNSTGLPSGFGSDHGGVADFNRDGHDDVYVLSSRYARDIFVALGVGDGSLEPVVTIRTVLGPVAAAVGDLNGDEIPDLIVVGIDADSACVHLGTGDGGFAIAQAYAVGGNPAAVCLADLDRDGALDVIAADRLGLSTLRGNGDGTLMSAVHFAVGVYPVAVASGDLNGDQWPDLAAVNASQDSVFLVAGGAGGSLTLHSSLRAAAQPRAVVLRDFSGDGIADLAVACLGTDAVWMRQGHGDATFGPMVGVGAWGGPVGMAVTDFDHDGCEDLVVAEQARWITLLHHRAKVVTSVSGPIQPAPSVRLVAAPNPARSVIRFTVDTTEMLKPEVEIHDVAGRLVAVVGGKVTRWEKSPLEWNGLTSSGAMARPGVYLASLRTSRRIAVARFVWLPR
jgi:hypothetical protein